jgi:hypothetical protein
MEYKGVERRKYARLSQMSDDEVKWLIEQVVNEVVPIATETAKKELKQELLAEIGSSAISKMLWLLFVGFLSAATWLGAKGWLKP